MSSLLEGRRSIAGRRKFLAMGAAAAAAAGLGVGLLRHLLQPDPETSTRILVARGFVPRIVARSGYRPVAESGYVWHPAPDGGGCFATDDGGWIYVSNGEVPREGCVGALRFDAGGQRVDAYAILRGSNKNCSGCETPWNTWLSCEETNRGVVWECDPFGARAAVAHRSLGLFKHESACVDPLTFRVYLTEDMIDGCLYRFTPAYRVPGQRPDLSRGRLEVALVSGGKVRWQPLADPLAHDTPLRYQVAGSARFKGGEGIDLYDRSLRFTTKLDNRVWQIDLRDDSIGVLHDLSANEALIDDIVHDAVGNMLIAEEGSTMRVLFFPGGSGAPATLLRLSGHPDSEITGLAFDPGGTRLYFSSQRGNTGEDVDGITFELRGDFTATSNASSLVEWNLQHAAADA